MGIKPMKICDELNEFVGCRYLRLIFRGRVDFGAIAGGEQNSFAPRKQGIKLRECGFGLLGRKRNFFPNRNRGLFVAAPNHHHVHRRIPP